MKPLFAIDLSENKKNEALNIEQFEVQRPSLSLKAALDAAMDEAEKTEQSSQLPGLLRAAQWLCGMGALLMITGLIRAMIGSDGVSLAQAYENAAAIFWAAGGCLILWGILKYFSIRKVKKVNEAEETALLESKLKSIPASIFQELGVPTDAPDVDVLQYRYKMKGGEVKPSMISTTGTAYMHLSVKLYTQNDSLYFVTLDGKFGLPLSAVQVIRKIDKKIAVIGWTKDQAPNEEPYSQYNIKDVHDLTVMYKPYYELHLSFGGENWTVQFPCYELPAFEAATGLKVTSG